jgi:MoxR-like ATPase
MFDALSHQIETVIRGKRRAIHLALVCLFAEGHLLVEDVPGVGKTSLAKAMARSVGGTWRRIQFTPDLLPSDVTGVSVWDRTRGDFEFRPGGVFANVVLADEINRASPKTQSALLEAMEEQQVTVDAHTYELPSPFLVIATQNPVELEGTYPLPEAQLDRFLLRLRIGYPDRDAELAILEAQDTSAVAPEELEPVADASAIAAWSRALGRVHVTPELQGYIVDIVEASRHHRDLLLGVSPRGALGLQRAARALAASVGRSYVVPDDIKLLATSVLEHRLVLSSEAMTRAVSSADVLASILDTVQVPAARAV